MKTTIRTQITFTYKVGIDQYPPSIADLNDFMEDALQTYLKIQNSPFCKLTEEDQAYDISVEVKKHLTGIVL